MQQKEKLLEKQISEVSSHEGITTETIPPPSLTLIASVGAQGCRTDTSGLCKYLHACYTGYIWYIYSDGMQTKYQEK